MQNWTIENGQALIAEGLENEKIHLSEGKFCAEASSEATRIDASDCYILPGIIDVHGDAFERIIEPRPGVHFDKKVALKEADNQMIANGITTAYHGLGVSWEPGVRAMDASRKFFNAWLEIRDDLSCETFLNIRWETYALDGVEEAIDWLTRIPGNVLSINDHATVYEGLENDHPRMIKLATRIGMTTDEASKLVELVLARKSEVETALKLICDQANHSGSKILAHDETSETDRTINRDLGMTVSEFPMTIEAARAAVDNGENVILGAPNVVRGGSHNKALCATTAIEQGLCTVLASDYYYPSQLIAAFKLVDKNIASLTEAWKLVSFYPAQAVGLTDRGEIRSGLRADCVLIDRTSRAVRAVFANGRKVYDTGILYI